METCRMFKPVGRSFVLEKKATLMEGWTLRARARRRRSKRRCGSESI